MKITDQQLIDELNSSLDRQLAWIAAIDSKVPPVFAIDVAMLGAVSALAPEWGQWEAWTAFISTLTVVGLLASIGYLAAASFPQLKGPTYSLIFFGAIANQAVDDFYVQIRQGVTEEYVRDMASQIHRNAEIALSKYRAVKTSMQLMFACVPLFVWSIMMLYQVSR